MHADKGVGFAVAAIWLCLSPGVQADDGALLPAYPFEPEHAVQIHNARVTGSHFVLEWQSGHTRYLVEKSADLMRGFTAASSNVVASNSVSMEGDNLVFYRVRGLNTVAVPDPALAGAIHAAIIGRWKSKLIPENEIYDVETKDITFFSIQSGHITDLRGMECMSGLDYLLVANNGLTCLDLQPFPRLQILDCAQNALSRIDLSSCRSMYSLYAAVNQLVELDTSACPDIRTISCSDNRLTALDVTANAHLSTLCCYDNRLEFLALPDGIRELYAENNCLFALTVPGSNLTILDVSRNMLTYLDLSSQQYIRWLNCSENRLASLVIRNTTVDTLDCSGNNLSQLILDGSTVSSLNCSTNQLTSLDLSQCYGLQTLVATGNKLTEIFIASVATPPANVMCDPGVRLKEKDVDVIPFYGVPDGNSHIRNDDGTVYDVVLSALPDPSPWSNGHLCAALELRPDIPSTDGLHPSARIAFGAWCGTFVQARVIVGFSWLADAQAFCASKGLPITEVHGTFMLVSVPSGQEAYWCVVIKKQAFAQYAQLDGIYHIANTR